MTFDILIVEDNPADFLLLERYFKLVSLSHSCVRINSNTDLITALTRQRWDVILLDYYVLGMDLWQTLELIKQYYLHDVALILISGELRTDDTVQLLRQGISDFVAKADYSRLAYAIERSVSEVRERQLKRESEQALRCAASVFDYTHEGIVICDELGLIVDLNRAFEALSGYSKAELVGQPLQLFASDRHDKQFRATIWAELLARGVWQGEISDRHKQGGLFVSFVTISLVADEHGQCKNFVALYADISKLK